MPIEFDKTPGSAKGVPPAVKPAAGEVRVRILKRVSSRLGSFKPGDVAVLPAAVAASWAGFGLAEQDKMVDIAPETKSKAKRG